MSEQTVVIGSMHAGAINVWIETASGRLVLSSSNRGSTATKRQRTYESAVSTARHAAKVLGCEIRDDIVALTVEDS